MRLRERRITYIIMLPVLPASRVGFCTARMRHISTAFPLSSNWNKPKRSGDKGPQKNYQNKLKKQLNKSGNDSDQNVFKSLHSGQELQADLKSDGGIQFNHSNTLRNKPKSSRPLTDYRRIFFLKASSGPRLQNFQVPIEKISSKLTLYEMSLHKNLRQLHLLQVQSYFDQLMDGEKYPYPRSFPVDNEDFNSCEHHVSFKDHVLLDHLVKGFPSKGPVRHFMELVLTGLSNNPDYTVKEKRDFINWYRDYFNDFSREELQA